MEDGKMIDSRLSDQRDEFFLDIAKGDLVFLQADDGSEISGIAVERSIMGWMLKGGVEVTEYDNYLGHVSKSQLTGMAA
jgi:hypothetical protein